MDVLIIRDYNPSPIVTDDLQLPVHLQELIEFLAHNAHENWAKQRIAEGWQYGEARDDVTKRHPCLVPYFQLSETEKEYDRIASREKI